MFGFLLSSVCLRDVVFGRLLCFGSMRSLVRIQSPRLVTDLGNEPRLSARRLRGLGVHRRILEGIYTVALMLNLPQRLAGLRQRFFTRPWLALGVLTAVPWVVSYYFVGTGGHDDSHITFYVARQLSTTGEYINYNHEMAEQSSSMGLVLVLAALHLVTRVSLPLLGYLTSMVGGSVAVVLTYASAKRLLVDSEEESARNAVLAAAICATTWCLLYWTTTGMEASLAAAAAPGLVLAMTRYEEQPKRVSNVAWFALALLLFVTLRPENVIIACCVAVALGVLCSRRSEHRWWRSAVWLAGAAAALTLLRLVAFGSALPRTVSAKSGGFRWHAGLDYALDSMTVSNSALFMGALLGLALAAVRLVRGQQLQPVLAAASAVFFAQLAFLLGSGGDWMVHGRFLVPAVPLACVLVAHLLATTRSHSFSWGLIVVLLVGMLQTCLTVERKRSELISIRDGVSIAKHYPALESRFSLTELACPPHLRDAPLVIALDRWLTELEQRIDGPVVLSSGQAGMVPYYASEGHTIQFIDLWDLTSGNVQDCAPEAVAGRSRIGTQIHLDWVVSGQLEKLCGLPTPHVVYSDRLSSSTRRTLERHGFQVVYLQQGKPKGKDFPRKYQLTGFIAVPKDLLTESEKSAGTAKYTWQ